jgi:hypothetical protein
MPASCMAIVWAAASSDWIVLIYCTVYEIIHHTDIYLCPGISWHISSFLVLCIKLITWVYYNRGSASHQGESSVPSCCLCFVSALTFYKMCFVVVFFEALLTSVKLFVEIFCIRISVLFCFFGCRLFYFIFKKWNQFISLSLCSCFDQGFFLLAVGQTDTARPCFVIAIIVHALA